MERMRGIFFTSRRGFKTWTAVCLKQYWKFAHYFSDLRRERGVVCDELDGLLTRKNR